MSGRSDDGPARPQRRTNLVGPRTGGSHVHTFFSGFASWVAKWTGSHWAFSIVILLVAVGVATVGVETTDFAISIVVLLMVFVLQNTQNRDSAALHLKLDEMVGAEPGARDEVRGVESRSEEELQELQPDAGVPVTD
ncbi:MAG: low affinity iron permease family protein [Gemmatimonadota bacterium]